MVFSTLMNDTITILKGNGQKLGPVKASVQKDRVFIMSAAVLIEPNDLVQREMSNGGIETFRVIDPCFYESTHGIQAHYQMHVKKLGIDEAQKAVQNITYNISISGTNNRFNNNSTDNSINVTHITNEIEKLRSAISSIHDKSMNKEDLFEIANEIEKQISNKTPNKTLLKGLLDSLPAIDNITSIANSISSLFL